MSFPADYAAQNPMYDREQFKLGIFSANCSNGLAITKVPEKWVNSWENNIALAKMTDAAGLDFLLPVARWVGLRGESGFHDDVLETITWACGLLAHTQRISVFATIHTAFNHPVVTAKQLATIDRLGKGRAGLNIVCGWNRPEYEALGQTLPDDHETRYAQGQEWFSIMRKLWEEEAPFDWAGQFYNLKQVFSNPKPVRNGLPIVNAAGSKEGREFAVKNADFLFTSAVNLETSAKEITALKDQGKTHGKDLDVLTFSYVVCRPTRKEAEEYHHYYAQEMADWKTTDRQIEILFANAKSFPPEMLQMLRNRMAAGHGGFPLVGSPDDVADGLESLAKAGFSGTTLCFVDYLKEFPYFRDEVLPRLEARGVRKPVVAA